jgi:hypothetical protein
MELDTNSEEINMYIVNYSLELTRGIMIDIEIVLESSECFDK